MIPADVVSRMLVEVAAGKPRTIEGEEAEKLYDQLEDECAEIREQGLDVEIPYEIPNL